MSYEEDRDATDELDIIDECRARTALAEDAEAENRKSAIDDIKFANGDQWPIDIKRDRDGDGRPCLTVNVTDAMVRRVTNAMRENRPRIKFHPVGNGADVQRAKVRNGMMRHIEAASSADFAYDTACESAVRGSWGYIRLGSDYINDRSFDQELKILPVVNPFAYYMDPTSVLPDGSDMNWIICSTWMRRTEYKDKYGDTDPTGWNFYGSGDSSSAWSNKEEIRVAEYWRIVQVPDTLYRLSDNSVHLKSELKSGQLERLGLTIIQKRKVEKRQIQWFKLSPNKILDRRDLPGRYIPIVPVYGRQTNLNGTILRKGMVADLKDPARMYNYAQTSKTEVYALMPKAPWLVAAGQLEGYETDWQNANRKPIVALPYVPVQNPDGSMAPPPLRQPPPQPNAGFAEWGDSTRSDFLAVAGMPSDPGQDARGEVVSGLAIKRRQGITDISHFDFYDNFTRSLKHLGTIVSELIPHYYDTERMQRIIGEDGMPEMITINEKIPAGDPMGQAIQEVKNDMTGGTYDCIVDTGPGYQTKREEGAEAMLELLGTPLGQAAAQVAGDVIVRSMDFPESDTIADRLAATMPASDIDKQSDCPPKYQMIIKTLQQKVQQESQKSMALELELKNKTHIVEMQEKGQTERAHIAAATKVHDTEKRTGEQRYATDVKAHVDVLDTHVKAVTAHDVAEIQVMGDILDTHSAQKHEKEMTREALKDADTASHRVD